MKSFLVLLVGIALLSVCASLSSSSETRTASRVLTYYETRLDSLSAKLAALKIGLQGHQHIDQDRAIFLQARSAYKRIEFIVAAIDAYAARNINGPDQNRNEDDSPVAEELEPHGLQVIERLLYISDTAIDEPAIMSEISRLLNELNRLRESKDRQYQLNDVMVWQALRSGMYRLICLGLTDADVVHSKHAIPETEAALKSMHELLHLYKDRIALKDVKMYTRGDRLFKQAIADLKDPVDFNTFDRLSFIRSRLDPLSVWITGCASANGFVHDEGLTPIYAAAGSIFGKQVFNIAFFSPNERYRLSAERITLGRQLFYDTRLSATGTRSCASCHQASKAFTDGLEKPLGLDGQQLSRNTPALWNTVFQTKQFYDSRTSRLENQLSAVVHNPLEMGGSLSALIPVLQADSVYAALFAKAYSDGVSEYNIANAISAYVRTLTALNSRFDRYMRHERVAFTAAEHRGFNLFMGKAKCGSCHYMPLFNGLVPPRFDESESEKLAVPASQGAVAGIDPDEGKYLYTKVPLHRYAFKTPGLRNIALTAPYMHNGVYKTLEEVMAFYNNGGGAGLGIDPGIQTLSPDSLHLSDTELKDIIQFMHALTDTISGGQHTGAPKA